MSIDGFASTSDNDYYTFFVTVQYCALAGRYTTICRDGISDGEAKIICQNVGYTGKSFHLGFYS